MKKIILLSLLALSLNAVSAQTTTVTPGAPFTINNGKDTLLLKLDPGKAPNKNRWGKPQQLQPIVIELKQTPVVDDYFVTRNQKTWWLIILSMAVTGLIVAVLFLVLLVFRRNNGGCNSHYCSGGNCVSHGCVHHQGNLTVAGNVKHAGEITQTGNVNHSGVVSHYHYQKTEEPAATAAPSPEVKAS